MNVATLVIHEITHRKLSFALGLISVTVGVGALVGALTLLRAYDRQTQETLSQKEDDLRRRIAKMNEETQRAMLHLGFNIVILPKDQSLADWYAEDYASKFMPEDYVARLEQSGLVTVEHLVPRLRQRVAWPETKWTVILVGTRSRAVAPRQDANALALESVPPGEILLGHEVHQGLDLKAGAEVQFMGRPFAVHKCLGETGAKDDMTVWINLRDAQELLNRKGLINEIMAVECRTAWANLPKVESEITQILPDTQVIEIASKVLAKTHALTKMAEEGEAAIQRELQNRANLRESRERFAWLAVPTVMLVCGAWLMLLSFRNVWDRLEEIGVFRSLGFRSYHILQIFIVRSVVIGLVGGTLGFLCSGLLGGLDPTLFGIALIVAIGLTAVACWLPAAYAARQDPALILRRE